MTIHDWHAPTDELQAFDDGQLQGARAASVEAHLLHCDRCRRALAALSPDRQVGRQEAMWAAIADAVDQPSHRTAPSAWWVRLAVGSPTLRWVTAALVAAVLVPPLAATAASGRAAWLLLFVLAPLAPVAAAVVAYRPEIDPAGSMAMATPLATFRLVLLRAAVVLAAALPVGVLVSALLPARLTLVLGWLLPGLALCAVVLAAGTRTDPARVGVAVSVAWAAVVVGTGARVWRLPVDDALDDLFVNQAIVQQLSAVVLVAAVAVFTSRRNTIPSWSTA